MLDDLRLGVSEACTEAILGAGGDGKVDLSLTMDGARILIRVRGPRSEPPQRLDGVDLLPALFDDAETSTDGEGRRSVSFSIPLT